MGNNQAVLIANVGERDLYYDVGTQQKPRFESLQVGTGDKIGLVAQSLGLDKDGARYTARAILERLRADQTVVQRLRYPILKTLLSKLLKQGGRLDQLVLIVTDQKDPRYNHRDTLFAGEVLKELALKEFPDRIKAVEFLKFQGNPSARDAAYAFLKVELPKLVNPETVSQPHVLLSAGTPALNDALRDVSLRLYRVKCQFYEVQPPPQEAMAQGAETGELHELPTQLFLRDLIADLVGTLLDRYDYSGAWEVLKTFQAVKFWDDKVEAVLQHAERRINLDFRGAAQAIQAYLHDPFIRPWHTVVSRTDRLEQIVETYYITKARCEHHEYADFLWRVRLIWESTKEEVHGHLSDLQWEVARKAHASLWPLVGLAGKVLHPDRGGGIRPVQGISAEKIEEEFKKPVEEVVKTLEALVDFLWKRHNKSGKSLPQNPYDQINQYVKESFK